MRRRLVRFTSRILRLSRQTRSLQIYNFVAFCRPCQGLRHARVARTIQALEPDHFHKPTSARPSHHSKAHDPPNYTCEFYTQFHTQLQRTLVTQFYDDIFVVSFDYPLHIDSSQPLRNYNRHCFPYRAIGSCFASVRGVPDHRRDYNMRVSAIYMVALLGLSQCIGESC